MLHSLDQLVDSFQVQTDVCRPLQGHPPAHFSHYPGGEFGYELYQHVPRIWYQCQKKRRPILDSVCDGMQPFYSFMNVSNADPVKCSRDPRGSNFTIQHSPPGSLFSLPPYRSMYRFKNKSNTFAYVFNKKGRDDFPSYAPSGWKNSWKIEPLLDLLTLLHKTHDQVIYFRPEARDTYATAIHDKKYEDFEMIRELLPTTLFLHELVPKAEHTDSVHLRRINTAQLILSVNADTVVGTQGGLSELASQTSLNFWFLCRIGRECTGKGAWWWKRYFENSTVRAFANERDLITQLAK